MLQFLKLISLHYAIVSSVINYGVLAEEAPPPYAPPDKPQEAPPAYFPDEEGTSARQAALRAQRQIIPPNVQADILVGARSNVIVVSVTQNSVKKQISYLLNVISP